MAYNGFFALTIGILSCNNYINHGNYLTLNQYLGAIQVLLLVPNHSGPSVYHIGLKRTICLSLSSHLGGWVMEANNNGRRRR